MCNAHFLSCFTNTCNLIKILKQYLNKFVRNLVLCIQTRFVSTEKNYAHRLACILLLFANNMNEIETIMDTIQSRDLLVGDRNISVLKYADDLVLCLVIQVTVCRQLE